MEVRKLGGAFLFLWAGCNCGPDIASQTTEGGGDGGGTASSEPSSSGPVEPSTSGPATATSGPATETSGIADSSSGSPSTTTGNPLSGSDSGEDSTGGSDGESSSGSTGEPSKLDTWVMEFEGRCDTARLLDDGVVCWRLPTINSMRSVFKVGRTTGQLVPEFGDGGVLEDIPIADIATHGNELYLARVGSKTDVPTLSRLDPTTAAPIFEIERPPVLSAVQPGRASVAVTEDLVYVLEYALDPEGDIYVRAYRTDDGEFVRDYSLGNYTETVGQNGRGRGYFRTRWRTHDHHQS